MHGTQWILLVPACALHRTAYTEYQIAIAQEPVSMDMYFSWSPKTHADIVQISVWKKSELTDKSKAIWL